MESWLKGQHGIDIIIARKLHSFIPFHFIWLEIFVSFFSLKTWFNLQTHTKDACIAVSVVRKHSQCVSVVFEPESNFRLLADWQSRDSLIRRAWSPFSCDREEYISVVISLAQWRKIAQWSESVHYSFQKRSHSGSAKKIFYLIFRQVFPYFARWCSSIFLVLSIIKSIKCCANEKFSHADAGI